MIASDGSTVSGDTPQTTKRRRFWLATLLSLLTPGLGQLYNVQYPRAVRIFIAVILGLPLYTYAARTAQQAGGACD